MRWMLSDPGDPAVTAETQKLLAQLATARIPRAALVELAAALAGGRGATIAAAQHFTALASALSPKAKLLARAAGKDLATALGELPDDSLAADWSYLCREMAKDLGVGAKPALERLEAVRRSIVQGQRARLVEVGSADAEQAIAGDVEALVRAIPIPQQGMKYTPSFRTDGGPFVARLASREAIGKAGPTFVGLIDPSMSMGVVLNLAPAPWFGDASDDAVLDYLASNLYTGHGGHSIYAKTWAAGLAYSNGLHPFVADGLLDYYAERCPVLPQTIGFVVDTLKRQPSDNNIARYAIASAFTSRIADVFEKRADEMAADLVDGIPPDLVRAFRARILELAKRSELADALFARMPKVYGKVLPGLTALDPKATYFVIGPEKQMAAYEAYLRAATTKDAKLYRLYARDFWIPAKL